MQKKYILENPGHLPGFLIKEMAIEKNNRVIIVSGPTAVGKTSVAIKLAKHFHTEIISADSRQCYKELDIGVARPSIEELDDVKHHFIASHSVKEDVNAITFEKYALEKVTKLFEEHDVVIMVGGTGLYIKAFCDGLDAIPDINIAIRQQIITDYETKGLSWLQDELKEKDPEFLVSGEIKNPQRMMRALEVIESTGNSILSYRKGEKANRNFSIIKIGLELPKEELIKRINNRVQTMMNSGLLAEVKSLLTEKDLNALQTVGYKELFDFIDGNISLSDAVERIKINSRQYAKRQMTWFKKDKEVNWFAPDKLQEMIELLN